MTGPDLYSPEPVRERNFKTLTMNEVSRNQTESEESLYAILSRLKVVYRAQDFVRIIGEFWPSGIPVVLHPDVIIDDPRFGSGIIESRRLRPQDARGRQEGRPQGRLVRETGLLGRKAPQRAGQEVGRGSDPGQAQAFNGGLPLTLSLYVVRTR